MLAAVSVDGLTVHLHVGGITILSGKEFTVGSPTRSGASKIRVP